MTITPDLLRRTVRCLEEAAQATDPYVGYMAIANASDLWPDDDAETPIAQALDVLYRESAWRENPAGMRWLASAAHWLLRVELARLTQDAAPA